MKPVERISSETLGHGGGTAGVESARLEEAQLDQLYRQAPAGVYGAAITAVVVTIALWGKANHTLLAAWCAASISAYVARQGLVAAYKKTPQGERGSVWKRRFILMSGLSAILWAAAGAFFSPLSPLSHQFLAAFLIGGICMGAVTAYSPIKNVYLPFILIVMIPLAGGFVVQGGELHLITGAGVIILMLCFIVIGNRMHATNTESLRMRFRNQDLVDALQREGDRTRAANQALESEINERKKAQAALRKANDELEQRVRDRTSDLMKAARELKREVGERREKEEALSRSEERFRAVFEAAEDCMFIKSSDLLYTHVNPAMVKLLGHPLSEIIGKTDQELFGRKYALRTYDLERRVLEGRTVESEHSLVWLDWPLTFNFIRFPIRDASGNISGLCGIARDVTGRTAREFRRMDEACEYLSPVFRKTIKQVELAAKSESIVLFTGESGTGKDWLARYLHDHSGRAAGPFFAINCAALPPELVESELFGHEDGAFTGARGRKRGLVELAEGGTLLLNEMGEMPPRLQSMLLTFLDTGSFTRVGGEKSTSPDVRVVVASNRDLEAEVEQGRFRSDLFYRLNVLAIKVPPLRNRIEDIPTLVDSLLHDLSKKTGISEIPLFHNDAMAAMRRYQWPGNVRELKNVLERALILNSGKKITASHLGLKGADSPGKRDQGTPPSTIEAPAALSFGLSLPETLEKTKRSMINAALGQCGGRIKDAALLLGITRESLKHHIRHLGIRR